MRESLGSTFMYNIIIIFIILVFAIIAGTLSYFKAFRVNNIIVNKIEKYEGYNNLAITEINNDLATLGYMKKDNLRCPRIDGARTVPVQQGFPYCIYYYCNGDDKYRYGVTTFISIDFPFVSIFLNIPITTETSQIRLFEGEVCENE